MKGSFGCFVAITMENKLPKSCRVFPESHVRGRKRKFATAKHMNDNDDDDNSSSCTVCLRYNSMLHMGFLSKTEMLVIEQPWLNVTAYFPGALERKIYGH